MTSWYSALDLSAVELHLAHEREPRTAHKYRPLAQLEVAPLTLRAYLADRCCQVGLCGYSSLFEVSPAAVSFNASQARPAQSNEAIDACNNCHQQTGLL